MSMDLVADVGNTRTHLALFEGERLLAEAAVPGGEAAAMRTGWEAFLADRPRPTRAAMAQVAPPVAAELRTWMRERTGLDARSLGEDLPCPIPIEVAHPEQVGADRLANAIWAARRFPGEAVVVVDLGTAVTFDVVSAEGAFRGGAIAVGARTSARALADYTAQLPFVPLPETAPPAIGRDTRSNLESGLFWGVVGLVEVLCARIAAELGTSPRVVATGGDSARLAPHCPAVQEQVSDLTLRGVLLALREAPPCASPA